ICAFNNCSTSSISEGIKRNAINVINAKSSTGNFNQRRGVSNIVKPSISAIGVVVIVRSREKIYRTMKTVYRLNNDHTPRLVITKGPTGNVAPGGKLRMSQRSTITPNVMRINGILKRLSHERCG